MDIWLDLDGTILDVKDRYYSAYARETRGGLLDPTSFWELKRQNRIKITGDLERIEDLALDRVILNPPDGIIVTRRKNTKLCKMQLQDLWIKLPVIYAQDKAEFLKDKTGVMIGDTEHDILSAKANGLMSVAVCSGLRSRGFLEKLEPDFIFEDLYEAYSSIDRIRAHWEETRRDTRA